MKTYLNDAIIGNRDIKIAETNKGEIIRFCYPHVDFREIVDFMHMGVKINDSNIIYLHNDPNNIYLQEYIDDTNILKTEVKNTYFNLRMEQTDFAAIEDNAVVRKYVFSNEHEIPLDIKFLVHSKTHTDINNFVSTKRIENGILQYSHEFSLGIISNDLKVESHKLHGVDEVIESGILQDKDYIGMSNNAGVCFNVGTLKPGEKKEFSIIMFILNRHDEKRQEDMENKIEKFKKFEVKKELQSAKQYWKKYLKSHMKINLEENSIYKEKIMDIYKRTILLFPLLTNEKTGGISAAMAIDEEFSMCGRYSYCWPRDAIYIAKALDLLKMEKDTEKFYKVFCKMTQSKSRNVGAKVLY